MIHSYPWYIADWRSSEAVMAMNAEQRGIYRELLDQCWAEGSLPTTEKLLQSISRVSSAEWKRSWPAIRPQFVERDGRLWHVKVDEKRPQLEQWHENRREAGKKGARTRWNSSANGSAAWPSSSSTTTTTLNTPLPPSLPQLPEPLVLIPPNDTRRKDAIEKTAKQIHDRHPARRRDGSVHQVEKRLESILKHKHVKNGTCEPYLAQINRNHECACRSDDWTKNGGEFAKSLMNWLAPTMERYDVQMQSQPEPIRRMVL